MFFVIFAVVALLLASVPARFRKIGFAIVGVLFLVFLTIVLVNRQPPPENLPTPIVRRSDPPASSRRFDFDKYQQDKKDKEDPEAKTRISISEVRFDQVQPIAGIEPGTIRSIRARLYNDSHRYTLTDYSYYLVVQDCLPPATTAAAATTGAPATAGKSTDRCTAVYDQHDSVSLEVPAGQARDIVIVVPENPTNFAPPFKLLGSPRIELTPVDTRAYQSKASS